MCLESDVSVFANYLIFSTLTELLGFADVPIWRHSVIFLIIVVSANNDTRYVRSRDTLRSCSFAHSRNARSWNSNDVSY